MDARSMSLSMSSVGKVLYDTVHRREGNGTCNGHDSQQHQVLGDTGSLPNNLIYCPSPYATTRVATLFFPDSVVQSRDSGSPRHHQHHHHRDISGMGPEQNCYDMPLIKQASLLLTTLTIEFYDLNRCAAVSQWFLRLNH
jgi:hypothetical protein